MNELCFSTDEEHFRTDVDQILHEIEADGVETIYVGESVCKQHSDFIYVRNLIEDMQNQASEEVGEYADSYLEDFTQENIEGLKQVISNYLNTTTPQPSFYSVSSIREVSVDEFCTIYNKEQS